MLSKRQSHKCLLEVSRAWNPRRGGFYLNGAVGMAIEVSMNARCRSGKSLRRRGFHALATSPGHSGL